jgi:arsenate reductase-like glutaredoxin family protein
MGAIINDRDFFQDRLSEKEIRALIGELSPTEFFSWKSPSFRRLGLTKDSIDEENLISLMLDNPRLITRPLVIVNGRKIDWKDEKAISKALST